MLTPSLIKVWYSRLDGPPGRTCTGQVGEKWERQAELPFN